MSVVVSEWAQKSEQMISFFTLFQDIFFYIKLSETNKQT